MEDYRRDSYVSIFNLVSAMTGLQILLYLTLSFRLLLILRKDWASYQSRTLPDSWYKMIQVLAVILIVLIGDMGMIFLVIFFIKEAPYPVQ